jgi:hypothetical protein
MKLDTKNAETLVFKLIRAADQIEAYQAELAGSIPKQAGKTTRQTVR